MFDDRIILNFGRDSINLGQINILSETGRRIYELYHEKWNYNDDNNRVIYESIDLIPLWILCNPYVQRAAYPPISMRELEVLFNNRISERDIINLLYK